jgi:hypothetical protein
VIDRSNSRISEKGELHIRLIILDKGSLTFSTAKKQRIFCIYGIINIIHENFLMVVIKRKYVGEIQGNKIFKIKKARFFPFAVFLFNFATKNRYFF